MGAEFRVDGRTDGQDEAESRISSLRESALQKDEKITGIDGK